MKLGIVSAICDGFTFEEAADKAFEGSKQRVMDSVALSCRYMRQFVI